LWDVKTGNELRQYVGHTAGIDSVTFSHDGKYILSTSDDSTARLWDAATGMELRRFLGHVGWVSGGAFSPDDKYVLTGANDGVARLWFFDLHDEIQYICSRLTRDFTDDERKQYEIKDNTPTCPKP
jgi:WD40 repeat protein